MSLTFEQIQPIIITAPTARNGVTLLQRLFNSSREIMIYGENAHLCEMFSALVYKAFETHLNLGAQMEATRRRFLTETTEFWSSNLWPDTQGYSQLMVQLFRKAIEYYQFSSEQYGFSRWGMKYPFNSISYLDRFMSLVPQGRYVYIYRSLFDVARSSKSRKFTVTLADYQQLADTWSKSLEVVHKTPLSNLLIIRYEELVQQPHMWIDRLRDFTGITRIDPEVMTRKFNTFSGSEQHGMATGEYIAPTALTAEETAQLQLTAGPMLERLHYSDCNSDTI